MIKVAGEGTSGPDKKRGGLKFGEFFLKERILPSITMLTNPRPGARHTMKVNLSRPSFPVLALVVALGLPSAVQAGPDTVSVTQVDVRQQTVVPWHKKLAVQVLAACGVVESAPICVAPGYLETRGPTAMMVYRRPAPLPRRRVTRPEEAEEKPTTVPAVPATAPASSPAATALPTPALAPVAPVPVPAPTDPEPGLLPETGVGKPAGQNRTDEMLSYFQRQRPVPHVNNGSSQLSPGQGPDDSVGEPSFLQTPQAPEQPVLPPSRATYHVSP